MNAVRSRLNHLSLVAVLILVTTSCALFPTPTPFVWPSATPAPSTQTDTPVPATEAVPATATPEDTQAPPDTPVPPTDTVTPADPPAGPPPEAVDMGRVVFDPGTTQAAVSGDLAANESHAYTMRVDAGQLIDISTVSAGELEMLIVGADGRALRLWDSPFHRGIVDDAQDYIVTVRAKADTSYGMTVIIPERVVFEAGAISAQVQVEIPANRSHHLVLRALGGQTMTIDATAASGEILTVVYGVDGTVLQSDHGGAPDFMGTLPSTQDYIVSIRALYGNPASVNVAIEIPPP